MHRGAWWVTVMGLQESDTTETLNHPHVDNRGALFWGMLRPHAGVPNLQDLMPDDLMWG